MELVTVPIATTAIAGKLVVVVVPIPILIRQLREIALD